MTDTVDDVLVRGRGLGRTFRQRGTRLFEKPRTTTALDDADIDVRTGSALGIIGESGSGKSTLVRILLGLDAPTSGTVAFDGRPVDARAGARSLHWLRRETGIVFQDPYASLDPRIRTFIAFQRDPQKQFKALQTRLGRSDLLNEYIAHIGGGLWACPPGVSAPGDWFGRDLFR